MLCVIWYHLFNLRSVKNTHGGVLLLVGFFSHFLNCANGKKLCKASHMLLVSMTVDRLDVPMVSIPPSFHPRFHSLQTKLRGNINMSE